jgi:hypothetical protein
MSVSTRGSGGLQLSRSIRHDDEEKGDETPDDHAEFHVTHSTHRGMNMSVTHGRDVNNSLLSHEKSSLCM